MAHIGKNSGPVQIRTGRTLLWTRGILPKSTTMAVSAHAQWQIRQKAEAKTWCICGKFIFKTKYTTFNYTRHTHTHHDVKQAKSTDEAFGGGRPPPSAPWLRHCEWHIETLPKISIA